MGLFLVIAQNSWLLFSPDPAVPMSDLCDLCVDEWPTERPVSPLADVMTTGKDYVGPFMALGMSISLRSLS